MEGHKDHRYDAVFDPITHYHTASSSSSTNYFSSDAWDAYREALDLAAAAAHTRKSAEPCKLSRYLYKQTTDIFFSISNRRCPRVCAASADYTLIYRSKISHNFPLSAHRHSAYPKVTHTLLVPFLHKSRHIMSATPGWCC